MSTTDTASPSPTVAELLAALRVVKDRKDAVNETMKQLNEWERNHEIAILAAMEQQGLTKHGDKVSSESGTFVRQTKARAVYDPEKWPNVVKWAVENGRTDIVQRRLSDTKVIDLMDSGVALPDGLDVQTYTDCSFRRA